MRKKYSGIDSLQALFLLAIFFLFAHSALAQDWPCIFGPSQDEVSTSTKLIDSIPSNGLPVLWKSEVGMGLSGVSVAQGKVFTIGATSGFKVAASSYGAGQIYLNKEMPRMELTVYCLDAYNGKEIWNYVYNVPTRFQIIDWRDRKHHPLYQEFAGPKSVPTADGDCVYVYDHTGILTCLDANLGKPNWIVPVREKLEGYPPRYGYAASPLIAGNLVVVPVFSEKFGLAAFNKKTGELVWTGGNIYTNNKPSLRWDCYATPRLLHRDGKSQILFYTGGGVELLDAATGKLIWDYPIEHTSREVSMNPIVDGDYVYVSSHYANKAVLLKIENDKPKMANQNTSMVSHYSSFVELDGYIYGSHGYDQTTQFRCWDMKNAKLQWSTKFKAPGVSGTEQAQLILADKKLVMLTSNGEVMLVEPNPQEFKQLGEKFPALNARTRSWNPMAMADGMLYCRDMLGTIACVDLKKEPTTAAQVAEKTKGISYREEISADKKADAGLKKRAKQNNPSKRSKLQQLFGKEKMYAGWLIVVVPVILVGIVLIGKGKKKAR